MCVGVSKVRNPLPAACWNCRTLDESRRGITKESARLLESYVHLRGLSRSNAPTNRPVPSLLRMRQNAAPSDAPVTHVRGGGKLGVRGLPMHEELTKARRRRGFLEALIAGA